jgi:hypothetical protein
MFTNRKLLTFLSTLFIVVVMATFLAFENTGRLKIKGSISDPDGKPLGDVKVTLKEFDKVISTTTTTGGGKFSIEVEYQQKQTIHFENDGFVKMYLQVISDIPLPKSDKNYTFSPALFLVAEGSDFNLNVFKKPFTRIVYDPLEDLFIQDDSALDDFVAETNEPEGVIFKGQLTANDSNKIDSATINVYEGKDLTESIIVDSTGNYEFKVFHNKQAKIQILAKNYYPTFFSLNTTLNDSLSQFEYEVSPKLELISKKTEYINPYAFEKPITEFVFNPDSGSFASNEVVKTEFIEVLGEPKKLPIEIQGVALDSAGKPLANVDVNIKEGERVISANRTSKNGEYAVKAPYDKDLTLEFSGDKYHIQVMDINTEREDKTKFEKITIKTPPAKIYTKDDAYIEEKLFEKSMAFIQLGDTVVKYEEDTAVRKEFEQAIAKSKEKNAFVVALANEKYPDTFGYLYLDGKVGSITGDKLDSAKVTAYVGNVLVKQLITDRKGIFEMELEYQKEFSVTVERRGYSAMNFIVDSKGPTDIADKDNTHKMDIPMIPVDFEGLNTEAYQMPFTKIYYDTIQRETIDDEAVLAAFQKRLNTPEVDLIPKKLIVNSSVQDFSRRTHKDLAIYVKEGETIVDTLEINREGEYQASLDYNKVYKIEYDGEQFFNSFFEVNTSISGSAKPDTSSMGPVKVFQKDDPTIVDPLIFQNPVAKVAYNPLTSDFTEDPLVAQQFANGIVESQLLAEIASKRVTVKGLVKDISAKRLKSVKVYVVDNFEKIDSVETDRRGEFSVQMPFQKNLKLKFESSSFYDGQASVDSRMPQDSIRNYTVNMSQITLVPENTEDIDVTAMGLPIQRIYYELASANFIEDSLANEQFLAKLWAPKEEKERLLAEEKAKNAATQIQTTPATSKTLGILTAQKMTQSAPLAMPPPLESDMSVFDSQDQQNEKEKEQSMAEKSSEAQDFLMSMMAPDTAKPKESFKNAQLDSEILDDIEFVDFELPEVEEVNENLLQQQEDVMAFNELIATSFLGRGVDIDSISIDSTLKVKRPIRVSYSTVGVNKDGVNQIFATYRTKIIDGDSIIDIIKKENWFDLAPRDFYLNSEKISSKEYITILEKYNLNQEQN